MGTAAGPSSAVGRRVAGHRRGKESVKEVVETARRLGIQYLSLYAFSSENWQRPKDEVGDA